MNNADTESLPETNGAEGTQRKLDDETLAGLGKLTLDELTTAIKAGNTQQALALAAAMHDELKGMHDLFLLWIASLLSYIGNHTGDAGVEEAMRAMMQTQYPDSVPDSDAKAFEELTDRERVEQIAAATRGHARAFTVEEKEDSYDLLIAQCGSGGQLIQRGVYEGPDALYTMQSASTITYGRENFTPYCTHCYLNGEFCPKGKDEQPIVEIIPASEPGNGTCVCRIYKQDV